MCVIKISFRHGSRSEHQNQSTKYKETILPKLVEVLVVVVVVVVVGYYLIS